MTVSEYLVGLSVVKFAIDVGPKIVPFIRNHPRAFVEGTVVAGVVLLISTTIGWSGVKEYATGLKTIAKTADLIVSVNELESRVDGLSEKPAIKQPESEELKQMIDTVNNNLEGLDTRVQDLETQERTRAVGSIWPTINFQMGLDKNTEHFITDQVEKVSAAIKCRSTKSCSEKQ